MQCLPKGQGQLFKSSLWFWMLSLRQLFWKFCHGCKILNPFMLGSYQLENFPIGMVWGLVAFYSWHKVAPSPSGARHLTLLVNTHLWTPAFAQLSSHFLSYLCFYFLYIFDRDGPWQFFATMHNLRMKELKFFVQASVTLCQTGRGALPTSQGSKCLNPEWDHRFAGGSF